LSIPRLCRARCLARVATPEEYDAAARHWPETCPAYHFGDRRPGRRLVVDFEADAAAGSAALLAPAAAAHAGSLCDSDCALLPAYPDDLGGRPAGEPVAAVGKGRLGRFAEVLGRLAVQLAAAPGRRRAPAGRRRSTSRGRCGGLPARRLLLRPLRRRRLQPKQRRRWRGRRRQQRTVLARIFLLLVGAGPRGASADARTASSPQPWRMECHGGYSSPLLNQRPPAAALIMNSTQQLCGRSIVQSIEVTLHL
jgi:hypothetical protein